MKKLYLHIGTEKTGTTLLQEWLYTNKKNLSKNGIYLPNQLGKPKNILLPTYFQGHLDDWEWSKRIQNKQEKETFFEGFLNRVTDEITAAKINHDTFIITSEHFHSRLQLIEEIQNLYMSLIKRVIFRALMGGHLSMRHLHFALKSRKLYFSVAIRTN